MSKYNLSRRQFLELMGVGVAGLVLSGCSKDNENAENNIEVYDSLKETGNTCEFEPGEHLIFITDNEPYHMEHGQIEVPEGYEYIDCENLYKSRIIRYNFVNKEKVIAKEYIGENGVSYPIAGTPIELENTESKTK